MSWYESWDAIEEWCHVEQAPEPCETCHGDGTIDIEVGRGHRTVTCPTCHGAGSEELMLEGRDEDYWPPRRQ